MATKRGDPVDPSTVDSIEDLAPTDRVWVAETGSGTVDRQVGHLTRDCPRCPADAQHYERQQNTLIERLCSVCTGTAAPGSTGSNEHVDTTEFDGSLQAQLQRAADRADEDGLSPLEAFEQTAEREGRQEAD